MYSFPVINEQKTAYPFPFWDPGTPFFMIQPRDTLNQSDFCDKRLKYRGFYRKNNMKSEAFYIHHSVSMVSRHRSPQTDSFSISARYPSRKNAALVCAEQSDAGICGP